MANIATSISRLDTEEEALQQAYDALCEQLGGPPSWTMMSPSATYDVARLQRAWTGGPLHGLTSSGGTMTEAGTNMGRGLSLLGIRDDAGAYGVGGANIDGDAATAAQDALMQALEIADRHGQLPTLLWVSCTPGHEERVIQGLEALVGTGVAIVGGSAADDAIEGLWKLLSDQAHIEDDGVVVTVMFPSFEHAALFQSGFQPTQYVGKVTSAEGRLLREIDGQPAARIYDAWTHGAIHAQLEAGQGRILGETSLHPLGRVAGDVQGIEYHVLSHPASVEGEALSLFTDVAVGEELCLMEGSTDRVVERAGRIAQQARRLHDVEPEHVLGALVIYCAGCMMTVRDRMDEVVEGVNTSLEGAPFLGMFTFGEQGRFLGGENRHGNLMVSILLFYEAHG